MENSVGRSAVDGSTSSEPAAKHCLRLGGTSTEDSMGRSAVDGSTPSEPAAKRWLRLGGTSTEDSVERSDERFEEVGTST